MRRRRWSSSSPHRPPHRSSASTVSRRRSDNQEKGTFQRFLPQPAAEVSRLGAADRGGKGAGGKSAPGRARRRAEKGHRARQEARCGEKGALTRAYTSSHSLRIAALVRTSSGVPSKTIEPCPMT